jgi:hypothetical protein
MREAEHAQRLGRQHHRAAAARAAAAPVEAAHARQILRARQLGLAALELDARARRAQQVAQPPGQQAPLVGLDEEVGGAGLVGAGDRRLVVEAGQHQHRHVLEAGHGAQLGAGLEAVQPRHHRVQHDDVRRPSVSMASACSPRTR